MGQAGSARGAARDPARPAGARRRPTRPGRGPPRGAGFRRDAGVTGRPRSAGPYMDLSERGRPVLSRIGPAGPAGPARLAGVRRGWPGSGVAGPRPVVPTSAVTSRNSLTHGFGAGSGGSGPLPEMAGRPRSAGPYMCLPERGHPAPRRSGPDRGRTPCQEAGTGTRSRRHPLSPTPDRRGPGDPGQATTSPASPTPCHGAGVTSAPPRHPPHPDSVGVSVTSARSSVWSIDPGSFLRLSAG